MDHNYQSSLAKSDDHQVIWSLSSSDHNQWISSSSSCTRDIPVKSYTCAFCQKGFSCAQALGGHMNIHRKDRAKLRQVFDENLLSLDITKPLNPEDDQPFQPHQSPKSPDSLCVLQDDIITCSSKDLGNFHHTDDEDSDKLQKIDTELDLELRLGPDQTHEISSASSTKNTRDFF